MLWPVVAGGSSVPQAMSRDLNTLLVCATYVTGSRVQQAERPSVSENARYNDHLIITGSCTAWHHSKELYLHVDLAGAAAWWSGAPSLHLHVPAQHKREGVCQQCCPWEHVWYMWCAWAVGASMWQAGMTTEFLHVGDYTTTTTRTRIDNAPHRAAARR